jgi:hypothetical protein
MNIIRALVFLSICTAFLPQKWAAAEEDGPIIPSPRCDSETGLFIKYDTPDIPQWILQILKENIKDSDGHNAIYYQCFFYRNTETIAALIKAGSYLYLDVNGGRDLLRLSETGSDWERNSEIIAMFEAAGCVDDNPGEDWGPYFRVDRH